jgi:DNA excision repair protein ERCC-4
VTARATTPPFVVLCDTREQTPIAPPEGVVLERVTMETGDLTTPLLQGVAVIERKSVSDFASSITRGRERFDDEVRRLLAYRWRCIVVEGEISEVWRTSAVHPHSVLGSVASFFARSDLPCLFAGTRPAAARLICGILRRWEERLTAERAEQAGAA